VRNSQKLESSLELNPKRSQPSFMLHTIPEQVKPKAAAPRRMGFSNTPVMTKKVKSSLHPTINLGKKSVQMFGSGFLQKRQKV
jgi:hypothetical protein